MPEVRRNEVVSVVAGGLQDFSDLPFRDRLGYPGSVG